MDAGQRTSSGMLLLSQKTWNTRSPLPYVPRVPVAYEALMREMIIPTWSFVSAQVRSDWSLPCAGRQRRIRSSERQWGRSEDGAGVRSVLYCLAVCWWVVSWVFGVSKRVAPRCTFRDAPFPFPNLDLAIAVANAAAVVSAVALVASVLPGGRRWLSLGRALGWGEGFCRVDKEVGEFVGDWELG